MQKFLSTDQSPRDRAISLALLYPTVDGVGLLCIQTAMS